MRSSFGLVLWAQEVVDGLHGIEGGEGHFDHQGAPVAHGAVPKTRQLECSELFAVLALAGYEAGGWVNVIGQVELLAFVVPHGTDEVNGIEVSALGEHLHVGFVVLVYLTAFEDLEGDASVGIVGSAQEDTEFCILHILQARHIETEGMPHEADDVLEVVVAVLAAVEQTQIGEDLLLYLDEETGNDLFPEDCIGLQSVGHNVVDVLDEDDVAAQIVEVLDECTMASGSEEKLAVAGAEGRVVHVDGDGVCAGLLFAEAYVVGYLVLFLCFGRAGDVRC